MSEVTRRDLVRIALAVTAAGGALEMASAQHIHQAAADDKVANGGLYKPKLFNEHEYLTLQRLAVLIVPADDTSPSALDAGACEFIDLLCSNNVRLGDHLHGRAGVGR